MKRLAKNKRKYIKGLAEGKTKKQAAMDAGYAESTAENAKHKIETPDVRAEFQRVIRGAVPMPLIGQRIREGIDAEETKFFQKDGAVVEQRNVIAWSERRAYTELAAEYGGYFVPRSEIEVSKPLNEMTDEELFARAQELLSGNRCATQPKG